MTKKILLLVYLFFLKSLLFSQYIDLNTIPKYDCNETKKSNFDKQSFIFIIPDIVDSILLERVGVYSSWYNDSCKIKKESELIPVDYTKHFWVVGTISNFKHWEKFSFPINKIDSGFNFNKMNFIGKFDAISFIDTNKIAFVGNSSQSLFGIREPSYSCGFDFTVSQNLRKTFFGNFVNTYDSVFQSNMNLLRQRNYRCYPSNSIDFYVSLKIDSIDIKKIIDQQNMFRKDFCKTFLIKSPSEKIKAYFHKEQIEILMVSGYWDRCSGHIYGLAPKGEIHTEGISTGLISHEYGHFLFDSNFKKELPGFIGEGVIEYYQKLKDTTGYFQKLHAAIIYADSLDFKSKLDDNIAYFDFGNDYPISGIFVKYIVDNYGMKKFILYCKQDNHLNSLKLIFDKTYNTFISDFKLWMKKEGHRTMKVD